MKFLYLCDTLPTNPNHRDRLPAIKEASEGLDFEIDDLFNFNSIEEAHEIRRGDIRKWFLRQDQKKLNQKFFTNIMEHDPDVLILTSLDCFSLFLDPDTIRGMSALMLTVGIFGDDEYMIHRNAHWVPMFDRQAALVKWCVEYYNTHPGGQCYWLPQSCFFSEKDFDKLQLKKTTDVFFMGSPFGNRPEILTQLVESGVKPAIFGSEKWNGYENLKPFYKGFLEGNRVDAEIRKSKLVLALLGNHLNGAPHMTTKPWDAVKNGVLPFSTYHPSFEDYKFPKNTVVMGYDSHHLVEQVNKYLLNDKRRVSAAKRMFNHTLKRFNYVDLYRKLFKQLERDYRRER